MSHIVGTIDFDLETNDVVDPGDLQARLKEVMSRYFQGEISFPDASYLNPPSFVDETLGVWAVDTVDGRAAYTNG